VARLNILLLTLIGGISRRASLKNWCPKGRESATLLLGTMIKYIEVENKRFKYTIDENGCWNIIYPQKGIYPDPLGYPRIYYKGNTRYFHKVSYIVFKEDIGITSNTVVRHTCDNIKCVNPNHLIKGTHEDNVKDRVERNRSAVGENNGRNKLREEDVLFIFYSNDTKASLSRLFNVDRKVIRNIKNKLTWKYLTKNI
jgi:hypothetical protein